MEKTSSPPTPGRGICNSNQVNSEIRVLIRKPLSQINNIPNQHSPVVFKRKYGHGIQDFVEENETKDSSKEHQISSSVCSDSSKCSSHSNGGIFPLLISDSSKVSHYSGTSGNLTPSPAQRSSKLYTPITSSSRVTETPSRSCQAQDTPKLSVTYNPFEECAEVLQLPTVSPSLFKEVVSPSVKEDKDFSWAIDQLAILNPTNIETSPLHETDIPLDPEYEKKAQDAIDRFFSSALVVPSPWASSSSHSINLMSALFSSSASSNLQISSPALLASNIKPKKEIVKPPITDDQVAPVPKTYTVWCQTELSLPPILSKEVEAALAPFCTFTQEQSWQHGEETDEASALNNTTLRRKLLFIDELCNDPPLSDPPSARVSTEAVVDRISELGSASPASTGPLPLDEEEAVLPWGVSMIRPSSRVSLPHSPSSPSFLHSSVGVGRSFSSSPSSGSEKSPQGALPHNLSPHGVSPIAYIPPKSFRTLLSPSECDQTPSRRRFLTSPKLSPIFNSSPRQFPLKTPSPLYSSRSSHPSGASSECQNRNEEAEHIVGRNSPAGEPLSWLESTAISNEKNSVPKSAFNLRVECDSNSQGFVVLEERVVTETTHSVKIQLTPHVKESSLRLASKTSPQFSSSPIKGSISNDSSHRSDFNKTEEEGANSPPKFSESPPVSPIAWSHEGPCLPTVMNERQSKGVDHHLSFLCSQNFQSESLPHRNIDDMEDVVEGGHTPHPTLWESQFRGLFCKGSSRRSRKEGNCSRRASGGTLDQVQEVIVSNVTYMDTDSPHYFEGSTLEETSCGQDTGYQTGSSLQTTNSTSQSHFIPLSSTNQTKDSKSPILVSPRESTQFSYSKDAVFRFHVDGGEEISSNRSPH